VKVENLGYLGKRWTGKTIVGQPLVNRLVNESLPKIHRLLDVIEQDKQSLPRTRNQVRQLNLTLRRLRVVQFTDHASFFILYGQAMTILKAASEEYYRRKTLQARLEDQWQDVDSLLPHE
jgi:hypothetical protein